MRDGRMLDELRTAVAEVDATDEATALAAYRRLVSQYVDGVGVSPEDAAQVLRTAGRTVDDLEADGRLLERRRRQRQRLDDAERMAAATDDHDRKHAAMMMAADARSSLVMAAPAELRGKLASLRTEKATLSRTMSDYQQLLAELDQRLPILREQAARAAEAIASRGGTQIPAGAARVHEPTEAHRERVATDLARQAARLAAVDRGIADVQAAMLEP